MKTLIIVVETAIISFFAGGMCAVWGQKLKEQEAAEQAAKENPES